MPRPKSSSDKGADTGRVWLVGAGPGDPGLLTLRALGAILRAEVVVHDDLVGPGVLDLIPPRARRVDAGKRGGRHKMEQVEIHRLLVREARAGRRVVRLQGGDPFLFGRGGEEVEALRRARVPVEVVPGVTSALAAPAQFHIPATHRDHASMVAVVTGHEGEGKEPVDWEPLARFPGTLLILMGVSSLPHNMAQLRRHGRDPRTPVAIIERGTLPDARLTRGTLSTISRIARRRRVRPPAVVVVGEVARLAGK
ncbi:MAG: uroporphyrinogen-III C-methyltransferase [Euryarchaeota archaeon]|nr:uroporphyrinogen-III C-methyltransferase [Euryarchaeota archaeon]